MAKKKKKRTKNTRAAYLERRNRESYQSYLYNRRIWSNKGYTLDEALNYQDYVRLKTLAQDKGEKNIARNFAMQDRRYTLSEIRAYRQRAEILLGESPLSESRYGENFVKRAREGGIDDKTKLKLREFLEVTKHERAFLGTKLTRKETFEILRDMGLGYRGADAVMYG